MTLRTRRRAFRLPSGESPLTRLTRVEGLLKELKDGKQPSKRAIARELVAYHSLLRSLWLEGLKKK
ncbi:hypothetical protein ES703_53983 [subsurface metagenome]